MIKCKICKNSNKIKFFTKKNKYSYYLCRFCQTLFLYPLPNKKKIKNYYENHFEYFKENDIQKKRVKKQAKKVIKILFKINPYGKTLLDIGSGYGHFLKEAKHNGLDVLGIEPSKILYRASVTHLPYIKVINTNFETFVKQNKNKKYDFITLIHVLEHLINPKKILEEVVKLLNKNGVLYIETPNMNSHLFNIEQANYTFLTPPDHLWIFSKKSIKTMLKNINSVNLVKISTYSYPEHFMGIIKKIIKQPSNYVKFNHIKPKEAFNAQITRKKNNNNLKFLIMDRFFAPIFTPLLNMGVYGSILELYIKKK